MSLNTDSEINNVWLQHTLPTWINPHQTTHCLEECQLTSKKFFSVCELPIFHSQQFHALLFDIVALANTIAAHNHIIKYTLKCILVSRLLDSKSTSIEPHNNNICENTIKLISLQFILSPYLFQLMHWDRYSHDQFLN